MELLVGFCVVGIIILLVFLFTYLGFYLSNHTDTPINNFPNKSAFYNLKRNLHVGVYYLSIFALLILISAIVGSLLAGIPLIAL